MNCYVAYASIQSYWTIRLYERFLSCYGWGESPNQLSHQEIKKKKSQPDMLMFFYIILFTISHWQAVHFVQYLLWIRSRYCKYCSQSELSVPLKVKPNPLACQPFRHRTYSEKPPGPAQISAKYNKSFGPTTSLYNKNWKIMSELQYCPLIKHLSQKNKGNDHQLKKLLILTQFLLVRTLGNV